MEPAPSERGSFDRQGLIAFWDRMAPSYADYTRGYLGHNRWVDERLQVILPGMRNLRIADIGTGCGFLAVSYAQLGHEVTATDISRGMLDQARMIAREKEVEIDFIEDDACDTRLEEGSYDLVVLRDVLCNLPDHQSALYRLASLLRPGGFIMVSDGRYFLHLHDPDYARRDAYFKMKNGTSEYARMVQIPQSDFEELESLVGGLRVNASRRPFPEAEMLFGLGMNNIRMRADDRDDYASLTEQGPSRFPLRFTLTAQRTYQSKRFLSGGKNSKSFLFSNPMQTPEALGEQFGALASPERVRILMHLGKGPSSVRPVAEALGLSENKASYHLCILREAGLVIAQRSGREVVYGIKDESAVESLLEVMSDVYDHRRRHSENFRDDYVLLPIVYIWSEKNMVGYIIHVM